MNSIKELRNSGNLDVRDGLLLDLIGLGLKTVSEISTDMILGKPEDRVEVNVDVVGKLTGEVLDLTYKETVPLKAIRGSDFDPDSLKLEIHRYLTGRIISEGEIPGALKDGFEVRYSKEYRVFYKIKNF
ncbi:hypothetical protein [Methanococcus maripaludis]|uniref:Uncharacterized protein n=1 Tax=Methanococcus maripaludis OS7 TaxID=637915 RepID=A0A2Z5PJX1_METMI|nr:hypothetical protein [Methanococcus maripaludis]BAP62918.1 hypothetical protein MMOS7_08320 [Methanococcus maripaludis OS7]